MPKTISSDEIRVKLFNMQDTAYRDFHSRLIPTVDKDRIIGVRTPQLRCLAKNLVNNFDVSAFLSDLPHFYYEENNLHAFIIESFRDFDTCIKALDTFLPYVDNWATCDGLRPKCFKNNADKLSDKAMMWLNDGRTYVKRFGIGVLMNHFLEENYNKQYLTTVSKIRSDEYYIKMMIAWFFAIALVKQYDNSVQIIENKVLDRWTHNKTIQKAVDSLRITNEQKEYLKTLRY